ncbi:MAG: hypothetical protein UFG06_13260 [Lachnospiraceae bacterium]|nr:hypothetical protein [Lachnospiraceae bacterium]
MLAFLLCCLIGIGFIGFGLYACFSKRKTAFGFWANTPPLSVTDVKAYNKALGKLWCIYGMVFIILCLPLFLGQNTPYALISVVGIYFETIAIMAVYVLKIEKKYKK